MKKIPGFLLHTFEMQAEKLADFLADKEISWREFLENEEALENIKTIAPALSEDIGKVWFQQNYLLKQQEYIQNEFPCLRSRIWQTEERIQQNIEIAMQSKK